MDTSLNAKSFGKVKVSTTLANIAGGEYRANLKLLPGLVDARQTPPLSITQQGAFLQSQQPR
jgi:hypothetical protein